MTSQSKPPFWNKVTIIAGAVTAVLVAAGTFLDIPEKIRNAVSAVSNSELERVILPSEVGNEQDVKVDASSGNSNAVASPETKVEIGSPSTNVNQAPVLDNQSSSTYGDQSQSVVVQPSLYSPAPKSSNYSYTAPAPKEVIAELPNGSYEAPAQPSITPDGITQTSRDSVLSPNLNQSNGNTFSVGGNVNSGTSSDTYNGTVYNGNVCEGAIGSSCAPESSTDNDFSGATITGNSSK